MLNKARFAAYLAGFLGVAAYIAAAMGYGTYDQATGMFDPAPINIYVASTLIVSAASSAIAALAWLRGWSRK